MSELLPLDDAEKFVKDSFAARIAGPNDVYGILTEDGEDASKSDYVPEVKDYDRSADLVNSIPFLLAEIQYLKCRLDCLEEVLKEGITITIPIPDPPTPVPPV